MTTMRTFFSRYRLLNSLLALALLLAALAVSPAQADIAPICSTGCVDWTEAGCLSCQHCCSFSDGHYHCTYDHNDRTCSE